MRKNPMLRTQYEPNQARTLRRVAEMPIPNTPGDLAEMDLVDYGYPEALLRMQDTFLRYSLIIFMGKAKKRKKRRLIKRQVCP